MLSADHIDARARGDKLELTEFDAKKRRRAEALLQAYLEQVRFAVGGSREEVLRAFRAVPTTPGEKRFAAGLQKLVLDGCDFEESTPLPPATLRQSVFLAATAERRRLALDERFDRNAVLRKVAAELDVDATKVEAGLYADLPGAHRLIRVTLPEAPSLVSRYELGRAQAVLLKAQDLVIDITTRNPADARALFRKLKFLQLLFVLNALPEGGYRITVDGPMSLFESSTRYGLRLALALPSIMACSEWSVVAQVVWGARRNRLAFSLAGNSRKRNPIALDSGATPAGESEEGAIAQLILRLQNLSSAWDVRASEALLDLPGIGLCVPDLEFVNRKTGRTVYFEQLGYWSRAAVWKRVEMVSAGLPHAVVFGVPKQLRVSEAVLDETLPSALYVFPRVPSARALLDHVEAVAVRHQSA